MGTIGSFHEWKINGFRMDRRFPENEKFIETSLDEHPYSEILKIPDIFSLETKGRKTKHNINAYFFLCVNFRIAPHRAKLTKSW